MMTDRTPRFWAYSRTTVGVVAVANLLPLFCLLVLEWTLTDLLVVYWLETGVALLVGTVEVCPARLVTVQSLDGRYEPSIRTKRGAVTVCGVPCYVRTLPLLGMLLVALGVWFATGLLAFFRAASPFAYSPTATLPSVAAVASLLALSHVATMRSYFAERRYRRTSATEVLGPPLAYMLWTVALVVTLADLTDHPANLAWLAPYPAVIAGCKLLLELLTRCRDRARFERIDRDADPFAYDRTLRQTLSPKRLTAALHPIERPEPPPRATVRPDRRGIAAASPFVGANRNVVGTWFGLLFGFAVFAAALGGSWSFAVTVGGGALVGMTLVGLVLSVPTHAHLEYRFHDDELVCYDRWLETTQWRLPYADLERVSVTRSTVGRVAGYGTVRLETTDGQSARLPYLRDYRDVADRLERARRGAR